jgi:AraC-like DNA-binding protein
MAGGHGLTGASRTVCIVQPDIALYLHEHNLNRRTLGGLTFYVSLENRLSWKNADGAWLSGDTAIFPPYTPHTINGFGARVATIIVEPELLDVSDLRDLMARSPTEANAFSIKVRALAERIAEADFDDLRSMDLETQLFGRRLPRRDVDCRVRHLLDDIRADPLERNSATELASGRGISPYRLLQLLNLQTGLSFRSLREWKRARAAPKTMASLASLTEAALDSGYPDSSHFSHSIRKIFGIRPRDLKAKLNDAVFISDY